MSLVQRLDLDKLYLRLRDGFLFERSGCLSSSPYYFFVPSPSLLRFDYILPGLLLRYRFTFEFLVHIWSLLNQIQHATLGKTPKGR